MRLDKKSFGKLITALLITSASITAASAQSLIVRSTGPSAKSFPAGKKLAANSVVTLKKLDQVTVLDKAGTRVLRGPGKFRLNGRVTRNQTAQPRLASFIGSRSTRRARTGAVRGAGDSRDGPAENPNLWFLDIRQGGKFCVVNPQRVVMWRPNIKTKDRATLRSEDQSASSSVNWVRGNPLRSWPAQDVKITNNGKYQLVRGPKARTVEISTVILDHEPADLDEAAEMLIANGCDNQLNLLVNTLNRTEPSAAAATEAEGD